MALHNFLYCWPDPVVIIIGASMAKRELFKSRMRELGHFLRLQNNEDILERVACMQAEHNVVINYKRFRLGQWSLFIAAIIFQFSTAEKRPQRCRLESYASHFVRVKDHRKKLQSQALAEVSLISKNIWHFFSFLPRSARFLSLL